MYRPTGTEFCRDRNINRWEDFTALTVHTIGDMQENMRFYGPALSVELDKDRIQRMNPWILRRPRTPGVHIGLKWKLCGGVVALSQLAARKVLIISRRKSSLLSKGSFWVPSSNVLGLPCFA